ncbi:hypothetical protein [Synechococcus sp. BS56D]|uniref:hypothetical protein n=1 Tax=Synechococcus sp. BS56D TaxID=2055944 RepID=UPI0019D17769|nr:hypothetical protein [Synechococcus sp. BS56D]
MSTPNEQPNQHVKGEAAATRPWEYRVIHLNVNEEKNQKTATGNPEAASQKFQRSLSPDFIQREFPAQYSPTPKTSSSNHPALQLQNFLNELGKDGWELTAISTVGTLQMLFFKRQASEKATLQPDNNNATSGTVPCEKNNLHD